MRIGIDARELCGRPTGVGRYLAGLLKQWSLDAGAEPHEFLLYAPEPITTALDARRFRARLVPGIPGTWWEQVTLPRASVDDRLDVWFAPGYTAPLLLRVPTVVAIHDLSFVAHPEWFRMREGLRRRWLTAQTARRARAVITISQFSRRELIDRMDVPDSRIHVIPPGVEVTRATAGVPPSAIGHGAPTVLFVGSIFNRRHVTDLIRAFAPIARAHADSSLDIVGDDRSFPPEDLRRSISSLSLGDQVRWHEYVTEKQLRDLYAQAKAFAFLSEYEGLGLTPLEALSAGALPVLLDTPVARESCGAAAVYVPPNSLTAITQALEVALFDEPTRAGILAAASQELAKYSWPRAASDTLTVLERSGAPS
jgi:glycosyltransferase involved in cell wall biosynthesis